MKMKIIFYEFLVVFCFGARITESIDSHLVESDLSNNFWKHKHNYFEKNKEYEHLRKIKQINKKKDTFDSFAKKKSNVDGEISMRKSKKLDWWQTCVIYQLYPRSFKDSDGNGVGDFQGIINKILYLKYLGVGAVWLNPIYASPGIDSNYDISNFTEIDKVFGSMDDFDELVKTLHDNGIKIILDFVPNHTSDQHEWFIKSVEKEEPYTDYYVWVDAKYVNGTRQPPNNWMPRIGGNCAWQWNEKRKQYYLHQFYEQMPDLNFRNTLVREKIKDVLRFWLDRGVDGFRMDAVSYLYEREDLQDAPPRPEVNDQIREGYTQCLNESYEELVSWRSLLDEYKQKDGETRLMTVESYNSLEYIMKFYGNSTRPIAHFPLNTILRKAAHKPAEFYVNTLSEWMSALPSNAWTSWVIGNHDKVRPASFFGEQLIDGLYMIQLLLPGTPVVYMADELGMTDTYLRDDQLVCEPVVVDGLKIIRDALRTPFQWDSSSQAGFSNKTKTWLPVNPNYVTLNAQHQISAERSHLKIFKEIVNLRQLEVFRSGDVNYYEISKYVFAFSRSSKYFKTFFVVVNVGSEMENVNMSSKIKRLLFSKLKVLVASLFAEQNNGDILSSKSFSLRPSAALVLESTLY